MLAAAELARDLDLDRERARDPKPSKYPELPSRRFSRARSFFPLASVVPEDDALDPATLAPLPDPDPDPEWSLLLLPLLLCLPPTPNDCIIDLSAPGVDDPEAEPEPEFPCTPPAVAVMFGV